MKRSTGLLATLCLAAAVVALAAAPAAAQESAADWRAEFEAVCSRTDAAMTIGDEELAALIARCDALQERLAAEPEVVRRVFGRRLQTCRSLFAYVLESRRAGAAGPEAVTGAPPGSPPAAPIASPAAPPPASP